MTLREAAHRTFRSVTTLRRYIRSGRLAAEKRSGRFGPEYLVSEADLAAAGLELDPRAEPREAPRPGSALARRRYGTFAAPQDRLAADAIPLSLYQELQMKHEQLLVQYGMFRANGMRVLELRAELESRGSELQKSQERLAEVQRQSSQETARLKQLLRRAELEQEGRGLEVAALREKVKALELLTKRPAPDASIERQFGEVRAQMRRVDGLTSQAGEPDRLPEPPGRPDPRAEPDH
jgi:hypothetical protein